MMIRLNNRITVFKGLAWLIFTAILVNLAFLSPLTAFARNEPQLNFQKAAPWQQQAAGPATMRTQAAPGSGLIPSSPYHIYIPLVVKAAAGPVVTTTPVTPTRTPTRTITLAISGRTSTDTPTFTATATSTST